jgi:hypothetical protein
MGSGTLTRIRQEATDEINRIAALNDGRLTPEQVVETASDPDNPLHRLFDWNDSTAAHKYRLDQARALIRSVEVRITIETRTITSVAYVRDPALGADEAGYRSVVKVRDDADEARDAVVCEFQRAASALRRAKVLAEVLGLGDEVQCLMEGIGAVQRRVLDDKGREDRLDA